MRLENKVAVITGASGGLGRAMTAEFLVEGAQVVCADLRPCEGFAGEDKQAFVRCDVRRPGDLDNLIKEAIRIFGRIDIMVNNAGIGAGSQATIYDLSEEVWNDVIAVNLSGVFHGCRSVSHYMREYRIKGSIINMASILGQVGLRYSLAYCAAKGGVIQLTRAGALDLAPYEIRMNAIAPAFIQTSMTEESWSQGGYRAMIERSTPLGRIGEATDVAHAAVYLASDESTYVTGSVLTVDGGWTAR
jgi:NAD(P)-dependent dehydrogenase (short-subunit alcohol dehydrogenase family)